MSLSSSTRTPRSRVLRRPVIAGVSALSLAAAAAIGASPASAASTWPATPSGVHQSAAGASWVTVAAHASRNARSYRLYVSTYKPDVYYANLVHGRKSSARHTATASRPAVTVSSLRYSTAPLYYRLVALNGAKASYSAGIGVAGLAPATPTAVTPHAASTGTYLTWSSVSATGFRVAQATEPTMHSGRRDYAISDTSHQFTPSGLAAGATYYFAVQAVNGPRSSGWSAPVAVVSRSRTQGLRVMSYNILNLGADGKRETGGVVAPWSQRRGPAAALITSVNPDVVGVQEGNWWVGPATNHVLQIDSLRSALGGRYALAHTEPRYGEPDWTWFRSGNYILYKPSVYRAVGAGGYWSLGGKAYGVYQQLQNISTGARVLVVNTHLTQPGGHANDVARQSETRALVADASSMAANLGVALVYLGDYNSNTNPKQYTLDGPGSIMRGNHIADARVAAQSRVNPHWDSANDYMRAPYHYDLYIDYIWLAPGVAASQWGMALHMSKGRFVGVIPSDHNPIWAQLNFGY